jgi:peptidoglycan/LPS O-acetylase OafA/YrhL
MSNNSVVGLLRKVMRLIPPLLMLLGIILTVSGIFNAGYSIESYPSDNQRITEYPRLFVGSVIAIVGVCISIFSYLIIHNKIGIARYFRDN